MDLPSAEQTPKIRFPSQSSSGAFSSLVEELWRARGRADPRIPRVAGTPLLTGAARHEDLVGKMLPNSFQDGFTQRLRSYSHSLCGFSCDSKRKEGENH